MRTNIRDSGDTIDALFERIKRLQHNRTVKLLEELGLYYGQPPILFVLWKHDGSTQTELSQDLRLTPATVTVALKRMEKADLVIRKPDEQDSRVSRVFLTEKGWALKEPVENITMQIEAETFANLTAMEKTILRRLFLQMEENLLKFQKGKLKDF
ncbi:MAG: MarR family transcriptional regulator [Clostridiales bacterium]|nr:MarR family transcriptional regulator [Clostridiales bacterium]